MDKPVIAARGIAAGVGSGGTGTPQVPAPAGRPAGGLLTRLTGKPDVLADDRLVSWVLRIVACSLFALIAAMIFYVFKEAWPSFSANGLGWFKSPPAELTADQQMAAIFEAPAGKPEETINAWPMIYATFLTGGAAAFLGLGFALLSAIFIVEFAPPRLARVLEPTVRLLAAVPSVVYGLFGLLVLVPFVNNTLISDGDREAVAYVVQLNGSSLIVAVVILTVMITPIMIAIITDALRSVPASWQEGSTALGVNRWRTAIKITVRAARPAILAALVLAFGRAIGEAIALSMVSGSVAFSPNVLDGPLFFLEPLRPLAATIVDNAEGLSVEAYGQMIYAMAAILLLSTMVLSLGSYYAKQSMRKYSTRG
ncbi:MAG: phosphate ABC transporter permease subunit PstC [Solirubrobacterales bacterium]